MKNINLLMNEICGIKIYNTLAKDAAELELCGSVYFTEGLEAYNYPELMLFDKKQMEYVICEITAQWRTPQEISDIIGKEIKYLKDKIIPTLIANGILVREFPNIPNHPNQRYRHSVR